MKYIFGLCVILCLAGCDSRKLVVERQVEPFADPSLSFDQSMALAGSELALAQFKPVLQRYGLHMLEESEPRWVLEVGEVAKSASALRVLHEYEVVDGGPLRRARHYYQVQPWTIQLTLSDSFMTDIEPQSITGMAIEDPAPDQRHEQGQWIVAQRSVLALRGAAARAERAAMADAAKQLAAFFQLLKHGQRIEIELDTTGMGQQGIASSLNAAANGQHELALEQLLNKVTESTSPSPQLLFNIAVLYDILGVYDEALPWYGRALEVNPSARYRAALAACRERSQQAQSLPDGWL